MANSFNEYKRKYGTRPTSEQLEKFRNKKYGYKKAVVQPPAAAESMEIVLEPTPEWAIPSSHNVFIDVGFDPNEARRLLKESNKRLNNMSKVVKKKANKPKE